MKKLIPHFIAILIFLVASVLFCKPVVDGNVLNQHDIVGWKGMAQNAFDYKGKHGHFPLWNTNLFGGMPNYQVAMEGKTVLPDLLNPLALWMPKPINFFFLACVFFYILCIAVNVNSTVRILSSLAYAFSTYNPVIIAAGHETQMYATALLPLILSGLIFTYTKRYWLGLVITTYATYHQIGFNHLQITYYSLLIILVVTIAYIIQWIKGRDFKHLLISGIIAIMAGVIGIAGSALTLKTTSEYVKFTMRGGKDIDIKGDKVTAIKTTGLDTSYAWVYSLGKKETVTLFMPEAFGGGNSFPIDENTHIISKLKASGKGEGDAHRIVQFLSENHVSSYWGLLSTSGPAYVGVIIFLLSLIGFVLIKSPLRWSLLFATFLGIFMAWGKYFPSFNYFIFQHLPLYNKFRAPSMAQVIPQFTICIMAAISFQKMIFENKSKEYLQGEFKKILIIISGLFLLLTLMYLLQDYSNPIDRQLMNIKFTNSDADDTGKVIVSGLKADRQAMFGSQLLRALVFSIVLLSVLYLYIRSLLKPLAVGIILTTISTVELILVSKQYLNEDMYVSKDEYESANFAPTAIDLEILKDTSENSNFRVLNLTSDVFNESRTSYFHKSVGGYHPAKLRIYQDIVEKYFNSSINSQIINMLNTKYLIQVEPRTNQPILELNPSSYGSCWLVKNVLITKDRASALAALGKTNLKDTAVIDASFEKMVLQPQYDSSAFIKQTKFDNDTIEYKVNAKYPQFAVFSEIYYPMGWNVYIDEKKGNYINTNYILRGMSIPAGQHTIKFIFEPESVKKGRYIMFIASILVGLVLIGGLFMALRKYIVNKRLLKSKTII